MAKHCTNCGHELRDTDKFCAECGTSVRGESQTGQQEYCEIVHEGFGPPSLFSYACKLRFWAKAVGPQGVYRAGQSDLFICNNGTQPHYRGENSDNDRAALSALVKQLTADGWQPVDRGEYWWNYRFRREVKS